MTPTDIPATLTGSHLLDIATALAEYLPGWTADHMDGDIDACLDGPDGQQLRVSPADGKHRVEVVGLHPGLPTHLYDSNPRRTTRTTVTATWPMRRIADEIRSKLLDNPHGYTARHHELRQMVARRDEHGLYVHLDHHLRDAVARRDDDKLADIADACERSGQLALAATLRAAGTDGVRALLNALRTLPRY